MKKKRTYSAYAKPETAKHQRGNNAAAVYFEALSPTWDVFLGRINTKQ